MSFSADQLIGYLIDDDIPNEKKIEFYNQLKILGYSEDDIIKNINENLDLQRELYYKKYCRSLNILFKISFFIPLVSPMGLITALVKIKSPYRRYKQIGYYSLGGIFSLIIAAVVSIPIFMSMPVNAHSHILDIIGLPILVGMFVLMNKYENRLLKPYYVTDNKNMINSAKSKQGILAKYLDLEF